MFVSKKSKMSDIEIDIEIDTTTYNLLCFLLNGDVLPLYDYDLLKLYVEISTTKVLPTDLLMTKFFEYVIYLDISSDVVDQILNTGSSEGKAAVTKFIQMIYQMDKKTKFTTIDDTFYKSISYLSRYIKPLKHGDVIHSGIPAPHPIDGRPRLEWCVCQHANCKKEFFNVTELVIHLTQNNVYTRGFHQEHENALKGFLPGGLTIEYVKNNNMTKCPSYICQANGDNFECPDDLIKHFADIGISPFWQPAKSLKQAEQIDELNRTLCIINKLPKIYAVNQCPICLENQAQVLINACGHHVYCIDCMKMCDKTLCPLCRTKIDQFWPFA